MAVINEPTIKSTAETLEQRFRRLNVLWLKETAYQSSSTKIKDHPAFREVVGLGDAVVPLLLRDLQGKPNLWIWALPEITGVDPVLPEDRDDIAKVTAAWLRWAKDKGIAW